MSNYYTPTYGTTKLKKQTQLNDDIKKLIAETQARKNDAALTTLATDRMDDTAAQRAVEKTQTLRNIELEAAAANLDEVQHTSLLGKVSGGLDYTAEHFARPAMAGILTNIFKVMPGEQAGEAALREATGINPLGIFSSDRRERMRDALEETKLPFGVYTAMEEALNPINYAMLALSGPLAAGAKAGQLAIRSASKVDDVLAAIDAAKVVSKVTTKVGAKVQTPFRHTPPPGLTKDQMAEWLRREEEIRTGVLRASHTPPPNMTRAQADAWRLRERNLSGVVDDVVEEVADVVKSPEALRLSKLQAVVNKLTKSPGAYEAAEVTATATKIGRLPDIEKRLSQVMSDNNARRLANIIVKYPGVRDVVGGLNPGVLVKSAMGRLVLGHGVLVADGEKFAAVAAARIVAIRMAKPQMVEMTQDGVTSNFVKFLDGSKPKAWGDLFEESPEAIKARVGKSLTQENADYIREYREIIEDAGTMLEESGFKELKDMLKEGGVYIPRFATSREALKLFFDNGPNNLTTKQSWMFKRYYDSMAEGIENRVEYLNPEELLAHHLKSVYRTVADQKLLKRIQLAAQETGSGIIGVARASIAVTAKQNIKSKNIRLNTGTQVLRLMGKLSNGDSITGKELLDLDKVIGAGGKLDGDLKIIEQVKVLKDLLNKKLTNQPIKQDSVFSLVETRRPQLANAIENMTGLRGRLNPKDATDDSFIGLLNADRAASITAYKTAFTKEATERNLGFLRTGVNNPRGDSAVGKKFLFDKETVAVFSKATATDINRSAEFFKRMAQVNGSIRLGSTGFDMGAGFLQGLPLLATNPAKWAIAQYRAIQAFKDPTAYAKYIKQHEATIREMSIDLNAGEFVEAWGQLQGIQGALLKAGPIGRTFKGGTDRAAKSFTAFTLVARVEMFEAMRPMALRAAKKRGRNIGDPTVLSNTLEELSEHVSKMTGFSSNSKLGISGHRSNVERALFFAPRYLRATTGAVADVFQGGIRGDLARTTLAKMAAGGTLMYVAICEAIGQTPQMDPTKKGFMEVSVNGTQFGPGSAWIALARTVASLGKADWLGIKESPDSPDRRTGVEGQEDESFLGHHIDPRKHTLGYFLRSKSSPIIGLGWDIALGKDMGGDEIDALGSPGEFLRDDIVGSMIPFWAQTFIPDGDNLNDDQSVSSKFLQAGAEFTGLRSSPTSFFAELESRRDVLANLKYKKNWSELNYGQIQYLNDNDTILQEMKVQMATSNLDSTDDLQRAKAEYSRDKNEILEKKQTRIGEASTRWANGEIDGGDWRNAQKSAAFVYRTDIRTLDQRADYQSAISSNNEYFKQNKSGIALDEAYSQYIQEIIIGAEDENGKSLYNKDGDLNFRMKEARLNKFKAHWNDVDPLIYQQIQNNFEARMQNADLISQRYYKGQDEFEFYWELSDSIVKANANIISIEIWDEYRDNVGNSKADALEIEYPSIKQIKKMVRDTKLKMRQLNPALDAYLYQFGYTTTFENATTKNYGKESIEAYSFDPFNLPMNN